MFDQIENRQHKRRVYRGAAVLTLAGQKPMDVQMASVSEGGLGVVAQVDLIPGAKGSLQLLEPGKDRRLSAPMKVDVQLIYSVFCNQDGGFRLGLKMHNAPAELLKAIRKYVSEVGT